MFFEQLFGFDFFMCWEMQLDICISLLFNFGLIICLLVCKHPLHILAPLMATRCGGVTLRQNPCTVLETW